MNSNVIEYLGECGSKDDGYTHWNLKIFKGDNSFKLVCSYTFMGDEKYFDSGNLSDKKGTWTHDDSKKELTLNCSSEYYSRSGYDWSNDNTKNSTEVIVIQNFEFGCPEITIPDVLGKGAKQAKLKI